MPHCKNLKLKTKILYNRVVHIFSYFIELWKITNFSSDLRHGSSLHFGLLSLFLVFSAISFHFYLNIICLRLEPFLDLTVWLLRSRDQPHPQLWKIYYFQIMPWKWLLKLRSFFHSVKFKVKWVILNGELKNNLFLCNYQMFFPPPSPTLNWKPHSSLKTFNFEKARLIP